MKASEFNKLSKEEKLKVPFKDKPTINKIGVGCAIPSIVFLIMVVILGTCNDAKKGKIETESEAISIGQVLKTDYFEITVNKVGVGNFVDTGNEFSDLKEEEGSKYIVLNVTFKNIDNESRMIVDGSLFINYNGKDYEFDKSETIIADGWGLMLDQINPLIKKTTKLVYKIPTEISGDIYYKPGRTDKRIILGSI